MAGRQPGARHTVPHLIDSPENTVVQSLRRLARRREPGKVLLEGPRVVAEAVAAGVELELLAIREGEAFTAPAGRTVTLSRRAFGRAAGTVTPQGVLAVARRREMGPGEALAFARAGGWPLIVLDGVQDPGNVGAIARTVAAVGARGLAVLEGGADPLGAKAVRASAGHVFRLAVGTGRWDELGGTTGYGAVAAGGLPPHEVDLAKGELIAFGGETRGLRRNDLVPVTIPIEPEVESLNVAAAAAVLLFELKRQLKA